MCRRACELGKKNQWAHSSTFGNRRSVSLHNRRYFFLAFFERAKESGKRARSARHARRGKATSRLSSAPRSFPAFLSSLEKRQKITPVMRATEV